MTSSPDVFANSNDVVQAGAFTPGHKEQSLDPNDFMGSDPGEMQLQAGQQATADQRNAIKGKLAQEWWDSQHRQAPTAGTQYAANTYIDQSQTGQDRANQLAFINQLSNQANGQGPSLAGQQLKQGQEQAVAQQMAMLGSQRGSTNAAAAQRNAGMQAANTMAQTNQAAASARIQEQLNAQGQLGQALTGLRGSDQDFASQQAQLTQAQRLANAGFGNQTNLANLQAYLENQQQNQQLAGSSLAGQVGLNESEVAAQQAYQQMLLQESLAKAGINMQVNQQNTAMAGQTAAAIASAIAAGAAAASDDRGKKLSNAYSLSPGDQKVLTPSSPDVQALSNYANNFGASIGAPQQPNPADIQDLQNLAATFSPGAAQGSVAQPNPADIQDLKNLASTFSAQPSAATLAASAGVPAPSAPNASQAGAQAATTKAPGADFGKILASMLGKAANGFSGQTGNNAVFDKTLAQQHDLLHPKAPTDTQANMINAVNNGTVSLSPGDQKYLTNARTGNAIGNPYMVPAQTAPGAGGAGTVNPPGTPGWNATHPQNPMGVLGSNMANLRSIQPITQAPSTLPQPLPEANAMQKGAEATAMAGNPASQMAFLRSLQGQGGGNAFMKNSLGSVGYGLQSPQQTPNQTQQQQASSSIVPASIQKPPANTMSNFGGNTFQLGPMQTQQAGNMNPGIPASASAAERVSASAAEQPAPQFIPTINAPVLQAGPKNIAPNVMSAGALSSDEEKELHTADKATPKEEAENSEVAYAKLRDFLNKADAHQYTYVDPSLPGAGAGTYVSPMAQELEDSDVGKSMVKEFQGRKMVDYGKGFGAMLAAQAMHERRLDSVEQRLADALSKKRG